MPSAAIRRHLRRGCVKPRRRHAERACYVSRSSRQDPGATCAKVLSDRFQPRCEMPVFGTQAAARCNHRDVEDPHGRSRERVVPRHSSQASARPTWRSRLLLKRFPAFLPPGYNRGAWINLDHNSRRLGRYSLDE